MSPKLLVFGHILSLASQAPTLNPKTVWPGAGRNQAFIFLDNRARNPCFIETVNRLVLLLCVLLLPSLPAPAAAGSVTKYEAWKLGRPGGYREKPKAPGRWFVRADSTSSSIADFAIAMALHRAAIRMKSQGFDHFSIVNFEINNRQFCRGCSYANQDVYLTVVGLRDVTKPAPCEAKPTFAVNCETLSVPETLAKYGPSLGQTPDLQEKELALLRAQ